MEYKLLKTVFMFMCGIHFVLLIEVASVAMACTVLFYVLVPCNSHRHPCDTGAIDHRIQMSLLLMKGFSTGNSHRPLDYAGVFGKATRLDHGNMAPWTTVAQRKEPAGCIPTSSGSAQCYTKG